MESGGGRGKIEAKKKAEPRRIRPIEIRQCLNWKRSNVNYRAMLIVAKTNCISEVIADRAILTGRSNAKVQPVVPVSQNSCLTFVVASICG